MNFGLLLLVSMAKKSFPEFIPPMMANSAEKPFDSPDFIFEIKLDGYRAMLDSLERPLPVPLLLDAF
jgi:ATP-dependent DNA ligase